VCRAGLRIRPSAEQPVRGRRISNEFRYFLRGIYFFLLTSVDLYVIIYYKMQNKRDRHELSRLRSALRGYLADLRRVLKVVFGRSAMIKGNVYELARKCGKPNCLCTRGHLHRSRVLTWSEQGKSRLLSLPSERVTEVKKKSEEYLRFRRARARVTEIHREILAVMDRMESLRREDPLR
jgi:hypothetical protein